MAWRVQASFSMFEGRVVAAAVHQAENNLWAIACNDGAVHLRYLLVEGHQTLMQPASAPDGGFAKAPLLCFTKAAGNFVVCREGAWRPSERAGT